MLKTGSLSRRHKTNGTPNQHRDWAVSVHSFGIGTARSFFFFLNSLFGFHGRKRDSSLTVRDGAFAIREVKHRKLYSTIRKICTKMSTLWHKTRDCARRTAWAVFFFLLSAGRKPCGRRAWHVYRMHNVTMAVAGTWTALAFFFSRASIGCTTSLSHIVSGGFLVLSYALKSKRCRTLHIDANTFSQLGHCQTKI